MNKKYKRILIMEVNWLGDVLFSTPLIRAVREKFSDAYIACMVHPRAEEVLKYNPRINEIILYDEKGRHRSPLGKWRLVSLLRKKRFDLAIILHRSFTRALMAYLAGIRERAGYATKKREILLTRPVELPDTDLHKAEYFLKIAGSLGCDTSGKDYEFSVTDKERKYVERELSGCGIKKSDLLVLMNPGANWAPKRWPEENFALLAERLITKYGAKVALSGAEKDTKLAGRIKEKVKGDVALLSGRTNLKQFGALAERADFVISGDSGPMHIAVAMKSKVIALFGPTSPALTGPYGSAPYRVIQKSVGCEVPCYDLTCGNYRCMSAITADDVLAVFKEMRG